MKQIFLVLIVLLINQCIFSQSKDTYSIVGNLKGLNDGEYVVMNLVQKRGFKQIPTDTAIVKEGCFVLKGKVSEGPRMYQLTFSEHKNKYAMLMLNNNEEIKIEGIDISALPSGNIREYLFIGGSFTDKAFAGLINAERLFHYFISYFKAYLQNLGDSGDFKTELVAEAIKNTENVGTSFYRSVLLEEVYEPAIPNILIDLSEMESINHNSFLPDIYNKLSPSTQQSYYGRLLGKLTSLCVGQKLPLFTLGTPEGKSLFLGDVIAKNKCTIINFWGSNSKNLERYQQELMKYYQLYKDKGLGMVGLSSDTSIKKWKIAVQELPWLHVSDLKGKEGVFETVYLESAGRTTTNALLDGDGRIVAWNIQGIELQYYLDKYLVFNGIGLNNK